MCSAVRYCNRADTDWPPPIFKHLLSGWTADAEIRSRCAWRRERKNAPQFLQRSRYLAGESERPVDCGRILLGNSDGEEVMGIYLWTLIITTIRVISPPGDDYFSLRFTKGLPALLRIHCHWPWVLNPSKCIFLHCTANLNFMIDILFFIRPFLYSFIEHSGTITISVRHILFLLFLPEAFGDKQREYHWFINII